jgi:hypothetical protein
MPGAAEGRKLPISRTRSIGANIVAINKDASTHTSEIPDYDEAADIFEITLPNRSPGHRSVNQA